MKSLIITLLAVFATATTAMAQRVGKAYSMHVNTTDGNSTEYKFINEPVATFSDGSMTIKTMAGKGSPFPPPTARWKSAEQDPATRWPYMMQPENCAHQPAPTATDVPLSASAI